MTKTLGNTDANGTTKNVKDVKFWGNGDAWQLICKASSEEEGWMKSTKAMEIPGVGCVVQVTTQQENSEIVSIHPDFEHENYDEEEADEDYEGEEEDDDDDTDLEDDSDDGDDSDEDSALITNTAKNGSYSLAESVCFVPGVRVQRVYALKNGEKVLVERRVVAMAEEPELTLAPAKSDFQ